MIFALSLYGACSGNVKLCSVSRSSFYFMIPFFDQTSCSLVVIFGFVARGT